MRLLAKVLCFAVATVAATPIVAKADSTDGFTFTDQGQTVTWFLPGNPTPDLSNPHFAVFDNVPVDYDGVQEIATYIEFPSSLIGGGVAIDIGDENPYFFGQGPQLFTGPTSSPVFLRSLVPFSLTEYGEPVSISISPEPATFLLLGSAIVLFAGARRRWFVRGVFQR